MIDRRLRPVELAASPCSAAGQTPNGRCRTRPHRSRARPGPGPSLPPPCRPPLPRSAWPARTGVCLAGKPGPRPDAPANPCSHPSRPPVAGREIRTPAAG
jgi:hypothetical protein